MAAQYVQALRAHQPEGPYLLGGWSMGGSVAFEMAQQLTAQGQQVALLALMDTRAKGLDGKPNLVGKTVLLSHFAKSLGLTIDNKSFSQHEPDAQVAYILKQCKTANLVTPDVGHTQLRRYLDVYVSNIQVTQNYRPKPYSGRVTLFSARERSVAQDPTLGWGKLATGGITTYGVPGNHFTMLQKPHVQVLAEKLRASIEEAMTR